MYYQGKHVNSPRLKVKCIGLRIFAVQKRLPTFKVARLPLTFPSRTFKGFLS